MRIHHVALRVADLERALAFYAGLLGLPLLRRNSDGGALRSLWLDAGGCVLMLERALAGSGDDRGSGHLLAFAVLDLAEWEARLGAAGVPLDGRTEHTLYLRDPDGHRIGLSNHPLS